MTAVVLVEPLEGAHPLTALGSHHLPPGLCWLSQVVPGEVPEVVVLVGTLTKVLRPHGDVSGNRAWSDEPGFEWTYLNT